MACLVCTAGPVIPLPREDTEAAPEVAPLVTETSAAEEALQPEVRVAEEEEEEEEEEQSLEGGL